MNLGGEAHENCSLALKQEQSLGLPINEDIQS